MGRGGAKKGGVLGVFWVFLSGFGQKVSKKGKKLKRVKNRKREGVLGFWVFYQKIPKRVKKDQKESKRSKNQKRRGFEVFGRF